MTPTCTLFERFTLFIHDTYGYPSDVYLVLFLNLQTTVASIFKTGGRPGFSFGHFEKNSRP